MAIAPILAVRDYDASLKFYTEKLGFTSDFTMQGPDGTNQFGFVRLDEGVQIGLGLDPSLTERGQGVVFMLYPDNFDIDAYYEQVQATGVAIESELKTEYWGDRVFSIKDPDGYYLTFGQTVKTVPMDEIQAHMSQPRE